MPSGYVIKTCHEGSDWAVCDFDQDRDEEAERYDTFEEAWDEALHACRHFNLTRRSNGVPMRAFDFTKGAA